MPIKRFNRSIGGASQFRSAIGFRLGSRVGPDWLDPGPLDMRRLDSPRHLGMRSFGRTGLLRPMQRSRPGDGTCQQHLCRALMAEVAISETHARHRSTEAAIVRPFKIEAWLERNTF